eukprot:CAMPEP_0170152582 /NCGR_PEP_ID=MMETSP0033_2-20121228/52946_1 /TAXON_ID=195969 /ORGANISM="Dolichomastix tenuilepis, Strain CCMP3274" /LENGTH=252 /DNA_ID=CAMNT_0010389739 /DNA_START=46 /DNA_END=804 /DNA_ORIENTATION=-
MRIVREGWLRRRTVLVSGVSFGGEALKEELDGGDEFGGGFLGEEEPRELHHRERRSAVVGERVEMERVGVVEGLFAGDEEGAAREGLPRERARELVPARDRRLEQLRRRARVELAKLAAVRSDEVARVASAGAEEALDHVVLAPRRHPLGPQRPVTHAPETPLPPARRLRRRTHQNQTSHLHPCTCRNECEREPTDANPKPNHLSQPELRYRRFNARRYTLERSPISGPCRRQQLEVVGVEALGEPLRPTHA